jgi:geranylgeranyl pyrophosphate synthase
MNDLRLSKDLEDIVFLLNYAAQLVDDISNCESELKSFIKERFAELQNHPTIQEAIFCVLPAGENEPANVKQILFIINTIINLA